MKIITWNVNGIRACYKKGLSDFIERESPDLLCVQETKAEVEQLTEDQVSPANFEGHFFSAKRRGYSGVATFCKNSPIEVQQGIGKKKYDDEGRVIVTQHKAFDLYNIYFPNGGSGEERHQYKQEFLADLYKHLKKRLKQGASIIVVGDYNVAYMDIDVYDPVKLASESGFLPEEREWFEGFLDLGFVDTFRHFHPDRKDIFTWWSYRERARIGNRGWRIDHICVSEDLIDQVKSCEILDEVEGSDHCPVRLEIKA